VSAFRLPIVARVRAAAPTNDAGAVNRLPLLTAIAVIVSLALVLVPTPENDPLFLSLAALAGGVSIGISFFSTRSERLTRLGVSLTFLLMAALLRQGEGGATSGFVGLFVIAVVFLALSGNRLDLVIGVSAMLVAEIVPIAVWGAPVYPSSGYRGAIVLTTATAIAALTIQQLLADVSHGVERDVLRRVVEAQETERRRLARELHDEAGQTLTSMLIGLKALEDAADAGTAPVIRTLRESVVETLRGLRQIVVELRPKALDDLGLVPALEALAANVSARTGVVVRFESQPFPRLGGDVETALYRIVQEALTNVVRHADARNATVSIGPCDEGVRLTVGDDGRGFDARAYSKGGFGLQGMAERVQLVGGRLAVDSSAARGTLLVVDVPTS